MKITWYILKEHEGEIIKPPWMGIAYYHFDTDVEVLYLIPFNFIIAWIRNAWTFIRYRFYPLKWEGEKRKAFTKGRKFGFDRGYESGVRQKELLKTLHGEEMYKKGLQEGFVAGCDETLKQVELRIKRDGV